MRDNVRERTAVQAMVKAKGILNMIREDRKGLGYTDKDFEWDSVTDNLMRVIEEMIRTRLTDHQINRISSECRQIRER